MIISSCSSIIIPMIFFGFVYHRDILSLYCWFLCCLYHVYHTDLCFYFDFHSHFELCFHLYIYFHNDHYSLELCYYLYCDLCCFCYCFFIIVMILLNIFMNLSTTRRDMVTHSVIDIFVPILIILIEFISKISQIIIVGFFIVVIIGKFLKYIFVLNYTFLLNYVFISIILVAMIDSFLNVAYI